MTCFFPNSFPASTRVTRGCSDPETSQQGQVSGVDDLHINLSGSLIHDPSTKKVFLTKN